MSYTDFITAASMGVFLSRYEPWGYTPLEAAAYLSTAVTTDVAGFGRAVLARQGMEGIYVVKMDEHIKTMGEHELARQAWTKSLEMESGNAEVKKKLEQLLSGQSKKGSQKQ